MTSAPTALTTLSAVIADDEEAPREQLRAALARLWPELAIVGEASDGVQALRLLHEVGHALGQEPTELARTW